MTVWIYIDTRYRVGHPDHIKAFADPEAAERWFNANDAEGVAFEYEVIECEPRRPPHDHDRGADRSVHAALEFALSSEPASEPPMRPNEIGVWGR